MGCCWSLWVQISLRIDLCSQEDYSEHFAELCILNWLCYLTFSHAQEEVQKLAAQIEFMRIVNMEMNNRHLKPKPGGYFTLTSSLQSPLCKASSSQSQSIKQMTAHVNNATISDDGHSGSNSIGTNSIGWVQSIIQYC